MQLSLVQATIGFYSTLSIMNTNMFTYKKFSCMIIFQQLVDFDVKEMIAHGTEGAVFRATCQQARHPDKMKEYAVKAMFNIFQLTSVTQVRWVSKPETRFSKLVSFKSWFKSFQKKSSNPHTFIWDESCSSSMTLDARTCAGLCCLFSRKSHRSNAPLLFPN